jgi:hypothetical protein
MASEQDSAKGLVRRGLRSDEWELLSSEGTFQRAFNAVTSFDDVERVIRMGLWLVFERTHPRHNDFVPFLRQRVKSDPVEVSAAA